MNIINLSFSDINGGAGIAATRIASLFCDDEFVRSQLYVAYKKSSLNHIYELPFSYPLLKAKVLNKLKNTLIPKSHKYRAIRSLGFIPTQKIPRFNNSSQTLLHLHWTQNELLTISQIRSLNETYKMVWTVHDFWPILGYYHYDHNMFTRDASNFEINHLSHENWLDKYCWSLKLKTWANQSFSIVCPSKWQAQFFKESPIFANSTIFVVPNPIDTDIYYSKNSSIRRTLHIPSTDLLIGFGAIDGKTDYRKGSDYASKLIDHLSKLSLNNISIIIFGNKKKHTYNIGSITIHELGYCHSEPLLAEIYSSLDLYINTSRSEIFGQTTAEAISCGTPSIVFDGSALSELVEDRKTGFVVPRFDISRIVEIIDYYASNKCSLNQMRINCRKYALSCWSREKVKAKYRAIYTSLL